MQERKIWNENVQRKFCQETSNMPFPETWSLNSLISKPGLDRDGTTSKIQGELWRLKQTSKGLSSGSSKRLSSPCIFKVVACLSVPSFLKLLKPTNSWVSLYAVNLTEGSTSNVLMLMLYLLIKESMCGIIFLRNIKKLDLFQYSNRQSKNIFFILIKIIIELSTQSKITVKLL
jgi:hypothetical protein